MDSKAWFYVAEGRRRGPFDSEQLVSALAMLEDPRQVLIWNEGLSDWTRAGDVPEVARRLPPPIPAVAVRAGETAASPASTTGRAPRPNVISGPVGIRGWLLVLCVVLTIVRPLSALYAFRGVAEPSSRSWIGIGVAVLFGVFTASSLLAGVSLWSRNPEGIRKAKVALWLPPLSIIALAVLVEMRFLFGGGLSGRGQYDPAGFGEAVGTLLGWGLALVVPAVVWTAYLNKSKRVAATYGLAAGVAPMPNVPAADAQTGAAAGGTREARRPAASHDPFVAWVALLTVVVVLSYSVCSMPRASRTPAFPQANEIPQTVSPADTNEPPKGETAPRRIHHEVLPDEVVARLAVTGGVVGSSRGLPGRKFVLTLTNHTDWEVVQLWVGLPFQTTTGVVVGKAYSLQASPDLDHGVRPGETATLEVAVLPDSVEDWELMAVSGFPPQP